MLGVWVFSIYAFLILFNPCSIFFLCSLCFNECILFPQKKRKKTIAKIKFLATASILHPALCADPAGALTSLLTLSASIGIHYLRKKFFSPNDVLCLSFKKWIYHPHKNPSPLQIPHASISSNLQKSNLHRWDLVHSSDTDNMRLENFTAFLNDWSAEEMEEISAIKRKQPKSPSCGNSSQTCR